MASESFTVKGTIKHIGDTEQISDKFKKRIIVLEIPDEKYPQTVPFEFAQKNTSLLDEFSVGNEATITFNLRGSEYKDKFYVSLSGWKIEGSTPF